ncbi:MAG: tRNA (adenine-N1)-methyltransferase [Ignisphaera sp.]|nr:tRNA (adenine-N1)-methyltransferase [Ignisphaera sp.]MCX8167909.1 tRNA (adenine-N1)-methyltransferase [Ignisphaera sp.]MDW8085724.1 tRNA (adenine-N1)-methyltransferase [Ignisphaera sp.]
MTPGLSKNDIIEYNGSVVIYIDRRRRRLLRIHRGGTFSSDRGNLKLDDLVGLNYGSKVKTSLNIDAWLLKPLLIDYLELGIRRVTQVIYPKDLGLILVLLGIAPGLRILEIGVGTGNTTIVLANSIRPDGHVYGYEIREEFLRVAQTNLEALKLNQYVTLKLKDAREGIDETDIDAAVVDIPDPWNVLDSLHNALKWSAPAVFFLPTMNQILKLFEAVNRHRGFTDIRCCEVFLREIELSSESVKPSTTMVGHTGYIMYARKVFKYSNAKA